MGYIIYAGLCILPMIINITEDMKWNFSVKDLNFLHIPNNRNNFALKDVSFKINSGEFITLCGKSGCGKQVF